MEFQLSYFKSWKMMLWKCCTLWPPHAKSWLIGKDFDAGRDWGQEEKGTTEDEMAGWHHWLDECESEWTPGVGDGQGGLACCDSWGRRVRHDWVIELNWTERLIDQGGLLGGKAFWKINTQGQAKRNSFVSLSLLIRQTKAWNPGQRKWQKRLG